MAEWISGNRFLTKGEMTNNAEIIYTHLTEMGWSINAICGMLGNMETESTINPAIWQNLTVDSSNGYGLVQWTPSTNYTEWADFYGYDITNGYYQLLWIDSMTEVKGQWIATDDYNITFEEFKTSTESAEWLASAFLKNFERAGVEAESKRQRQALFWYKYITEVYIPVTNPDIPIVPDTPTKKNRLSKLLLYAVGSDIF